MLCSKELTNRSDFPDLKVCGLANSVSLLLHGEPTVKHNTWITGRIARRYIILTDSKNIRKIRRFGRVKEQSFSLVFIQLELVVNGPLLYIPHTVLHVAERGAELYNSVSSANMWCITEWRSVLSDRGCVYTMKRIQCHWLQSLLVWIWISRKFNY